MPEHALYDSFIKTNANSFWHKLSHLFKRSLKFLNGFKIVAIVGKRKFDSEPHEPFVECEAFLNV